MRFSAKRENRIAMIRVTIWRGTVSFGVFSSAAIFKVEKTFSLTACCDL
jgi:hypothetical protein